MQPNYVFFTELPATDLLALIQDGTVIKTLQRLGAGVCMGLVDLSDERANIVRVMNRANIPVIAGILVSESDGYWANVSNAKIIAEKYDRMRLWSIDQDLVFDAVGIYCLPNINLVRAWFRRDIGSICGFLSGFFKPWKFWKAMSIYRDLAGEIRADGYRFETYLPPWIFDERMIKSRFLQMLLGVVDTPSERDILLLPASTFQAHDIGLMWSYGRETSAFGIGSTGREIWRGENDPKPIQWEDFIKTVRHAWYWSNTIYIYSLEGCTQQEIFDEISEIMLDDLILEPKQLIERVDLNRISLQALLWGVTYLPSLVILAIVSIFLFRNHHRRK